MWRITFIVIHVPESTRPRSGPRGDSTLSVYLCGQLFTTPPLYTPFAPFSGQVHDIRPGEKAKAPSPRTQGHAGAAGGPVSGQNKGQPGPLAPQLSTMAATLS